MEKIEGLSSLSKRVKKLENETTLINICEEDDLIEILQRKQKQNKKTKLNELNEVYLSNLVEKLDDASKDNFVNVCKFTIEFIEQNINQISLVLQTKVSEELKNIVCTDFINRLYTGEFTEQFLENSIEAIKILINTHKSIDNCCINEKCECLNCGCKKKKGFFKK